LINHINYETPISLLSHGSQLLLILGDPPICTARRKEFNCLIDEAMSGFLMFSGWVIVE